MKVGFIGLGSMGKAMALNLLRAKHDVTVYNRTRKKAEELKSEGGRVADSPAEAARDAEALITMLADDRAVEEVIFGNQETVIESLGQGNAHLSMSTISVGLSRRLAEAHHAKGQVYIAAPVFGRPEAAQAAKLSIVTGGPANQIERFRPLFDAIGQAVYNAGNDPPAANVIKLAGNFMIASMIETLSEAYALAREYGIEPGDFLEIVNGSLFKSPIYQNYGRIVAEERFEPPGFKMRLGLKDVRLALQAAEEASAPMPLASLIHDNFLAGIARGRGDLDWAAISLISAENAGLETKTRQRSAATG
jgi:3-hydroxyisobutyrate dehydrogenase-like beta-hydroxyacid dehydrogenase